MGEKSFFLADLRAGELTKGWYPLEKHHAGELKVKFEHLPDDTLNIQVIQAKDLVSIRPFKNPDPYVKVSLILLSVYRISTSTNPLYKI